MCEKHQIYMTGIVGLGEQESYHPNKFGHTMIFVEIAKQLNHESLLTYSKYPSAGDESVNAPSSIYFDKGAPSSVNTTTLALLVLGVVLFWRSSRIPSELIGIAMAVIFAMVFHVDAYGVEFLGSLPSNMPNLIVPTVSLEMLNTIMPTVLSIALVVLVQSSMTARSIGSEHDDKIQTNQDTAALGIANIASALFHGYTVSASPPRSQLADSLGMRSQLSGIVASLAMMALIVFGSTLLHYVPLAALAAIVCTAETLFAYLLY
jgi:MFS superfamily sulfate permease-like transporter